MKHEYIFYTSIKKELKKRTLFRALFFTFFPLGMLFFAGIFSPIEQLQKYGFWIVTLFFLSIGFGFIPYQRIKLKENSPDEIKITFQGKSRGILFLSYKKKPLFIPFKAVKNFKYIQKNTCYGIEIWKKEHSVKEKPNIFLPYFTKGAFQEIQEIAKLN